MRPLFYLVTVLAAGLISAGANAQGPAVRPEIGKPVPAASGLIKARRGKEAVAKVREAQGVGNRTAYENYLIDRVLGLALAAAGDHSGAARAFESVLASPAIPDGEKRQFLAAAAGQH